MLLFFVVKSGVCWRFTVVTRRCRVASVASICPRAPGCRPSLGPERESSSLGIRDPLTHFLLGRPVVYDRVLWPFLLHSSLYLTMLYQTQYMKSAYAGSRVFLEGFPSNLFLPIYNKIRRPYLISSVWARNYCVYFTWS
jgi:hypothetical protein